MSRDHGRSWCRSASGIAEQVGDDGHRQRFDVLGDQVHFAGALEVVEVPVDERLDPHPEPFDGARRERLEHEPSQPRVVGRLAVEHAVAVQLGERRVPRGRRRSTHLLVGRRVQVGAAQPPVAQQPVDVRVARDEPLRRPLVVDDRVALPHLTEHRVRVGDERRVGRVEPEVGRRRGHHGRADRAAVTRTARPRPRSGPSARPGRWPSRRARSWAGPRDPRGRRPSDRGSRSHPSRHRRATTGPG